MRRLRPAAPLGISIGDRCARGGRRARSDAAPSLRKIVENGRGLRTSAAIFAWKERRSGWGCRIDS